MFSGKYFSEICYHKALFIFFFHFIAEGLGWKGQKGEK